MEFDIKIIIDTRERDLSYIGELDKRRRKDGTKIIETEIKTCKPLHSSKSVADITFEFRIDGAEWQKTSLAIEIKKGQDLVQSLSTKYNYERLLREVDRAVESGLDFYFVCDTDISKLVDDLKKLELNPRNKIRIGSHVSFVDKYLKFNNDLVDKGYKEGILISSNLWFLIRRLIKNHIKKEKLLKKSVDKK